MTAVASPPSLQPLQRLGWNSSGNGSQTGLNAEDVSRMFLPRNGPQRTKSTTSVSSASSTLSSASDSTVLATEGKPIQNGLGEREGWSNSRYSRSLWPSSKQEVGVASTASVPNGRPQVVSPPSSGQVAAPAMSALHQNTPIVPSQKTMQVPQQSNGARMAQQQGGSDPPALLVLLPMNGTFERKQITVPLFPEILRIGRQTNAKTVPTPANGYFDSKVLSRQHAEIWADRNGKIWIRDVKSSNGTFVNGTRLSPESRDSEPHELRENDMLELGIDIVSEDQKSIVHHKVSAKVEHAGIHNNTANVLDLNFGDIDPSSSGGLMGAALPQHAQMRNRGSSQGSVTSNGRHGMQNVGGNMNGLGVQRHMNAWLNPVSVEQVVKKLATELKQAKQQSQDLHRTTDFFSALLAAENGQEPPKPPAEVLPPQPQTNGISSPHKKDPMSQFFQPPAPPPQLPLPDKPDITKSMFSDSSIPMALKRNDTEKVPQPVNDTSPNKQEPSSILSLVEALTSAKNEIASQGVRVTHLEELLKQERRAREYAEERARHLLDRSKLINGEANGNAMKDFNTHGRESSSKIETIARTDSEQSSAANVATVSPDSAVSANIEGIQQDTKEIDASTSRLQERLTVMVREMDEMKSQMEIFRRRAESAETERTGLVEMVQRIRQQSSEEKDKVATTEGSGPRKRRSTEMATQTETSSPTVHQTDQPLALQRSSDESTDMTMVKADAAAPKSALQMRQLQDAVSTALAAHSDDRLMQSAPYASILGVVLIGVGIMSYLNGWQKIER